MIKLMPALLGPKTLPEVLSVLVLLALITGCTGASDTQSSTPVVLPTVPAVTPILPPTVTPPPPVDPQPSPPPTESPDMEAAVMPTAPATAETDHTVQHGDTLLGLARQYGVPMAAIQLRNEMGASTIVRAGQRLSIPSSDAWEDASVFWIVHKVAPGETLIPIARAYGIDLERLQAVNSLEDADRLAPGQNLVLPLTGPAAPVPPAAARASVPTPTTAPEPTTVVTEAAELTEVIEPPQPTTPASAPPADLAAWPREIARLINEVRAEHGLPALTYQSTLEQAAQAHADDCSRRGWCSHTGSDGSNIRTRVARAGYSGTGWAECWAQTQTPRRAVEVWMNETPPNDPHRRTLLSTWFSEIGIGVADAQWGTYIIANFGRP